MLLYNILYLSRCNVTQYTCIFANPPTNTPMPYHAMQGDDSPGTLTSFISPPRALIKTVMQTAGELDFETIFNEANLLYSPCAYLLFITFVVVMPILFSNLLVRFLLFIVFVCLLIVCLFVCLLFVCLLFVYCLFVCL